MREQAHCAEQTGGASLPIHGNSGCRAFLAYSDQQYPVSSETAYSVSPTRLANRLHDRPNGLLADRG